MLSTGGHIAVGRTRHIKLVSNSVILRVYEVLTRDSAFACGVAYIQKQSAARREAHRHCDDGMTRGKEPTIQEYSELLAGADFRLTQVFPTSADFAVIEATPT